MDTHTYFLSAFEPSGDRLGAAVVARLKEIEPDCKIVAYGGSLMEDAGAELLENTCAKAVMGLDILPEVPAHLKRLKKFEAWLHDHPLTVFVPIDSPAAHWSLCKKVRKKQPKTPIYHLVMPQVWAWANWRMNRLKKLSDHVMCLLPFEATLCKAAGIDASFVGHPVFAELANVPTDTHPPFAAGSPKLTILAGSRKKELERNLPTFLQTYQLLKRQYPTLHGALCLRRDKDSLIAQSLLTQMPCEDLHIHIGQTPQGFAWCDAALIKSGTSTLEAAAHETPHVMAFCGPMWQWHAIKGLIKTRTFALPNLIGQALGLCDGPVGGTGRIIPEFCPYFGDAAPLAEALKPLLDSISDARLQQLKDFQAIKQCFAEKDFATSCANKLVSCHSQDNGQATQ